MNLASEGFVVPARRPALPSTLGHVNLLARLATPPAAPTARGHFVSRTLPSRLTRVEPFFDLDWIEAQGSNPPMAGKPILDPIAPPPLAKTEAFLQLRQGNQRARLCPLDRKAQDLCGLRVRR